MAIAGTCPILWGLATNHLNDSVWITLSAEAISWVEMKGSFNWRVRTLFIGALLALFWGVLGTITGDSMALSVVFMFIAAFLATLLKNLGDRASGLAICVYLLFIICNAYPDRDLPDIDHRIKLIAVGAAWSFITGIATSVFMPVQQPFRRQIALIWRAISALVGTISRSGIDQSAHEELFVKEREVRSAIDHSFDFYGRMVHQGKVKDNRLYQLLLLRKNAALVAINVIAMGDEMEHIDVAGLDETLRVKAATLFSALKEAVNRMSVFVLTLKPEEKILVITQINRLRKLTTLIRDYPLQGNEKEKQAIQRILQLTGRTIKLLESALQRMEQMGEDIPVFRSYSLMKTMLVLRPRKILSNIKTLSHVNTLAMRFALRSAIAASVALFIARWFHINHGYWLPFSLMIVIQPYFGATLTKAIQRVAGTLLGGLAGSLFLFLPAGLHLKEAMLFITFLLMVYFARKNYGIAAFVITLNVVLLFNIDQSFNAMLLIARAACTLGGSLLAVVSGFALLPAWDKKWLPNYLTSAIKGNYAYFIATFFEQQHNWIRSKRSAETANSNAFDSFNRYMQEPGKEKTDVYYDIITSNVRITRDLNTINIEQDEKAGKLTQPGPELSKKLLECLAIYHQLLPLLQKIDADFTMQLNDPEQLPAPFFALNETQLVSLEKLRIELLAMLEDMKGIVGG